MKGCLYFLPQKSDFGYKILLVLIAHLDSDRGDTDCSSRAKGVERGKGGEGRKGQTNRMTVSGLLLEELH